MDHDLKSSFRVSDEIELRAFTDADVEAVFERVSRNSDHLMPFMHWMTPDYSLGSARDFVNRGRGAIAERNGLSLGVFRGEELIGSIGFVYFDWRSRKTEIGYWIDKANEGKGIVSAACVQLIEYAFGDLGLNRIEIRCSTQNLRSAAIPERLGFRKEGHLRQAEMRNGQLHDFAIYGLLADEWRARQA